MPRSTAKEATSSLIGHHISHYSFLLVSQNDKLITMQRYSAVPSLNKPIEEQLKVLSSEMPSALKSLDTKVVQVSLVGSVAEGTATYRSDLDLWFILKTESPTFSRVSSWKAILEKAFQEMNSPLPIQIHFLAPGALNSSDPAVKNALSKSLVLYSDSSRET